MQMPRRIIHHHLRLSTVTLKRQPFGFAARQCRPFTVHSSASSAPLHSVSLLKSSGSIHVSWGGGAGNFNPRWLWYNAPQHVHSDTGQRLLSPLGLAAIPTPQSVRSSDDRLNMHVLWSDGSEFTYSAAWLQENSFSNESLAASHAAAAPKSLSPTSSSGIKATDVPTFAFDAVMSSEIETWRWLRSLNEFGLTLVNGAPLEHGTVLQLASRVSQPMRTIYGESFDVVVTPDPINVAYSSVGLEPHIDLVYYESPPGLQLLHCRRFDEGIVGGSSTFIDGFLVAEELRMRRPDAFATLVRVPATFQKVHYRRAVPAHIVCQRPHITIDRSLVRPSAPVTEGDITGVFWAPPFEGQLRVCDRDIDAYYDAHAAFSSTLVELEREGRLVEYRMKPGDISVFNNRRMLHGRRAFSTPLLGQERNLQGAYINVDEFKSRLLTLCSKFGGCDDVRRVFNQQAV
jgi:alpha-ketoglutarate-dependent taurine dioxygenase